MRKSKGAAVEDGTSYFTYRPLSNLPTPPPTARQPRGTTTSHAGDDVEGLPAMYRGPAIHLVNLIPSTASLASASVHLVQSMLSRSELPLETIALAVCVLDSLDAKFGRKWRLTCPLRTAAAAAAPNEPATPAATPIKQQQQQQQKKRHSLPLAPQPSPLRCPQHPQQQQQQQQQPQLHIDSVQPEIIVLAALVIADKFTRDSEQTAQAYCASWGRGLWSPEQLNATERSIMEGLGYRIMPLCDEDCLADAMADMQLAGREHCRWDVPEPSPPHSDDGDSLLVAAEDLEDRDGRCDGGSFAPSHARSKTMMPTTGMRSVSAGVGLGWATVV